MREWGDGVGAVPGSPIARADASVDQDLEGLLRFDPLDTAERITGRRDDDTTWLGMALAQRNGDAKRAALEQRDDTMLSNGVDRYLRICGELGFEEVLRMPFQGRSWSGEEPPGETFHVLAHRDGMLLAFDTFNTKDVNGAKVWYNWRPRDADTAHLCTSSGSYHAYDREARTGTWVGDHDAREALRHKIRRLRENGEFLSRWERRPFLWLLHHMDTKVDGYDHDAINAERIGMLPDWVRTMITPGVA